MKQIKDIIWTRLMPDKERIIDVQEWTKHGGKWIVFDSMERTKDLADKLEPHIDQGEIESAKYWNGDPSAVNVYSLDRDRMKTFEILKKHGARHVLVWEYDYALGKNLRSPLIFAYSWFSKFRTILQSRGMAGTARLARDILRPKRGAERKSIETRGRQDAGNKKGNDHL